MADGDGKATPTVVGFVSVSFDNLGNTVGEGDDRGNPRLQGLSGANQERLRWFVPRWYQEAIGLLGLMLTSGP